MLKMCLCAVCFKSLTNLEKSKLDLRVMPQSPILQKNKSFFLLLCRMLLNWSVHWICWLFYNICNIVNKH